MLYFSVRQIVLATDSSESSLNVLNSNRTFSNVHASFESRLKTVLDLVTDLYKDFQSFKSESGRANYQPLNVQMRNSGPREANAKTLQLQTQKVETRKENADLQAQLVSDGVNHTIFL